MRPIPPALLATSLLMFPACSEEPGPAAEPEHAESSQLPEPHPDLPDDFQQLLPRGEIPAVNDPTFVTADKAKIDGDAWVLGIVVDGQAHAYSLNLLNRHEVVNDRISGRPIAAVW